MTIRAALYSRVSSEMQLSGHSLDAQRRALHDACTLRGYTIALEETDEALSARSERIELRPGLTRILAAVDAGALDVLLVHSLDRLSRNVLVTLQVFKRLAAHNVTFISLSENIDYTSPEGRLQLTILGAFCAFFSDNLARHVGKGKKERVLQGLQNNPPPFGYQMTDGHVTTDPRTVDAAREMWRLAALGWSDRQVADALLPLGHVLSRDTVRYLVTNRFFCGQVCYRGDWHAGQHEALIDEATFQAVQAQRAVRRRRASGPPSSAARPRGVYPLSGLLTCARCGRHMNVNERSTVLCWGRRGYQCDQPIARLAVVEAQVGDVLGRLTIADDELQAALAAQSTERPRVNTEAVERTLERLRRQYAWGHLTEESYMAQYRECEAALKQAHEAIAEDDALDALHRLRDLARLWQDGTPDERQTLAATLVKDILIDARHIVGICPHEMWQPLVRVALVPMERPGYFAVTP